MPVVSPGKSTVVLSVVKSDRLAVSSTRLCEIGVSVKSNIRRSGKLYCLKILISLRCIRVICSAKPQVTREKITPLLNNIHFVSF